MIMNKILDKTPLKSRTAWSHLRTLKQASEVVSSWPEWKRTAVVFRNKFSSKETPETGASEIEQEPRKRSA